MAAAAIALAACSGGGGLNEDESAALQERLDTAEADTAEALVAQKAAEAAEKAAQAEKVTAEAEKLKAETEKTAAEIAKAAADDARDAAVAVAQDAQKAAEAAAASAKQAAAALVEAKAAEEQAKVDQKAAEDEAAEAERLRRLAVAAADTEEQRRQQAEADRDRSDQEAEDARQTLNREQAQDALAQLKMIANVAALTNFAGTVTPNYRAQATVTGVGPFASSSGSTDGGWYVTRFVNRDRQNEETLVVYSGVGPPTSEPIKEVHTTFTEVVDTSSIDYDFSNLNQSTDPLASLVYARSFPTNAVTSDPYDPNVDDENLQEDGPDMDRNFRNDYTVVQFRGTFDGASGNFRCTGDGCTVTHHGGRVYTMSGGWSFRVSETARVSVKDESFTHFGWWKNADLEADTFMFSTFTGGMGATPPDTDLFSSLEGTYTYRGRAAGQYALYSPIAASSSTGEFSANATLQASFGDTDTISGRITGISGQPNWELTLNETTITAEGAFSNAADDGGVDRTIGGYKNSGGSWNGQFYFDEKAGAVPTAAVGAFIGDYDGDGRIIGAFGAHRR